MTEEQIRDGDRLAAELAKLKYSSDETDKLLRRWRKARSEAGLESLLKVARETVADCEIFGENGAHTGLIQLVNELNNRYPSMLPEEE